MNTRTPRMTPHCRVIVSGASFALNSTSSRPDLSLAPSLVGIRRTRDAVSPSSSWISSVDQVVNSLKKTVPKHDLWKGWIVTAVSLSDRIEAIFFSASMAEGTSFTRNRPGLEGLQDRTRPHFDSVERTWIVESSPWKLTTTDRGARDSGLSGGDFAALMAELPPAGSIVKVHNRHTNNKYKLTDAATTLVGRE